MVHPTKQIWSVALFPITGVCGLASFYGGCLGSGFFSPGRCLRSGLPFCGRWLGSGLPSCRRCLGSGLPSCGCFSLWVFGVWALLFKYNSDITRFESGTLETLTKTELLNTDL